MNRHAHAHNVRIWCLEHWFLNEPTNKWTFLLTHGAAHLKIIHNFIGTVDAIPPILRVPLRAKYDLKRIKRTVRSIEIQPYVYHNAAFHI